MSRPPLDFARGDREQRRTVGSRQSAVACAVGSRQSAVGRPLRYHPQQSVLNPQAGQRQTACMRYISAPQRSHTVGASPAGALVRID